MNEENNGIDLTAPEVGVHSESPDLSGQAKTDAQADPASDKEPVPKTFTQAELDAIVQKRVAKAEAKAARRVDDLHRETLRHLAPQSAKPDTAISRDDYTSDAEWIDAKVEARLAERDARSQAQQRQAETQTLIQTTEKLYAEAEKIKGFDREVFDELPVTPTVASAIMDSDIAPKLMAHFVAHPNEIDRIAGLSPTRQAAEVGKIEQRLTEAPKGSKASAPITPVGNGRTNAGDIESMSPEDFYAARQKAGSRYYSRG